MRKAIAPVYQPIVDIETGSVLHYEALARINNGSCHHGQVIELGEMVGFINLIDIAMLEHVIDALRKNPRAIVAVNVSGATIDQSCNELLATVFRNMEFMRRVVFEITETSEICDQKMLNRFLVCVRLLESRVALDDFGTGFCTLRFVEKIKPEFVKLAGNIVESLDRTGDDIAIREVCNLVRGYGGHMIAEHVDTKSKCEAVCALGIRYLQGFYVGGHLPSLPDREPAVVPISGSRQLSSLAVGA